MIETRRYCFDGQSLPLVYEAVGEEHGDGRSELLRYLSERRGALLAELRTHGALLFRGFPIEGPHAFQAAIGALAPTLLNYEGGDSPRSAVTDKVYTSTSYPAALPISLHNEMSYSRQYPAIIAFYCEVAPEMGGATPLADCRRVLGALSSALVERFRRRQIRYVQNLHAGAGLGKSWAQTFETADRDRVEAILRERAATFEWRPNGALRVAEVVDPVVTHPTTGEPVFFSQAHLWHVSSLDRKTRDALLKVVPEAELYHSCTFGDGSPIDEADLDEIRREMEAVAVEIDWRRRDLLVVDNVLVAHGRRPFQGHRRILVAMG